MFRLTPQHDVICHSERGTKFHKLIRYAKTAVICLALSLFVTLPVFADTVPVPTLGENSAYTLEKVNQAGENTITKYEWSDKENKLIPVYYRVDLSKTEYGHPEVNDETKTFTITTPNADGTSSAFKYDIKYYVDNSRKAADRITTDQQGADINKDFIDLKVEQTSSNAYGGAIYNDGGTIGDITGDFIGNYAQSDSRYAYGGAIYNYSYNGGAKIGNITGDFIGNYASLGGAIYNYSGTIKNMLKALMMPKAERFITFFMAQLEISQAIL